MNLEKLANGLALDRDLVLPGKPTDPEMRESTSIWLFDEKGEFSLPRFGIEAEAHSWDKRGIQANFAFRDGRVLDGATVDAPAHSPIDSDGHPTVLGAGPLAFRCIEPFRRWSVHYDGPVRDGNVAQQISKTFYTQAKPNRIRVDAELTMVTPAWIQEVSADVEKMSAQDSANAQAMGLGYRFEHHFRAQGVLEVDGKRREFKATGTRIHRQSIRRLDGFFGHCWLSALFPDGRAFGCLAYPPKAGSDEYSYNDAVIYQGGELIKARVVEAPFMHRLVGENDDVSVVLESKLGITRIAGTTTMSTCVPSVPVMNGLALQQGAARFTWDDQSTYGMVERSSYVD